MDLLTVASQHPQRKMHSSPLLYTLRMEPSFLNIILHSLPLHMNLHPASAASWRRPHTARTAGSLALLPFVGLPLLCSYYGLFLVPELQSLVSEPLSQRINESGKAVVPYREGGWWFNGRGDRLGPQPPIGRSLARVLMRSPLVLGGNLPVCWHWVRAGQYTHGATTRMEQPPGWSNHPHGATALPRSLHRTVNGAAATRWRRTAKLSSTPLPPPIGEGRCSLGCAVHHHPCPDAENKQPILGAITAAQLRSMPGMPGNRWTLPAGLYVCLCCAALANIAGASRSLPSSQKVSATRSVYIVSSLHSTRSEATDAA
ncbi:hypothetical protein HaLaN_23643, partial [Haematococcus lacustris]